jgi:hypothetical protein
MATERKTDLLAVVGNEKPAFRRAAAQLAAVKAVHRRSGIWGPRYFHSTWDNGPQCGARLTSRDTNGVA